MDKTTLQEWLKLPERTKNNIFEETAKNVGLPYASAVEKDWWVVRTLELIFKSSIAQHTVFKGGTSLSKAWGLIDRFSEDIDLALDRKFLGFDRADQDMTNSQVVRLRKKSFKFITETYFPELQLLFLDAGFEGVSIKPIETQNDDEDPRNIEIIYPSFTEQIKYIKPRVLIEIGSRSMMEPCSNREFRSFVGVHFADRPFADDDIMIPTVNPERTFLEKIFLLHEEFQRKIDEVKVDRRSRHFYDLEKLMDTEYAHKALSDSELYSSIVLHRQKLTAVRGIDYANHNPEKINIIPPDKIRSEWEDDYKAMQESMFIKPPLPFEKLMERMAELNQRINKLTPKP
jgi:hypothetical protein